MNPYLAQAILTKNPDLNLPMREAEVEVLRRLLFSARAEAFEYLQRIKNLESHLYKLSELVLAGEWKEAQEIASRSLALLYENCEEEG